MLVQTKGLAISPALSSSFFHVDGGAIEQRRHPELLLLSLQQTAAGALVQEGEAGEQLFKIEEFVARDSPERAVWFVEASHRQATNRTALLVSRNTASNASMT